MHRKTRRMAPKLKKLDDEDKYITLKEKLRIKKGEKALKNTQTATLIATKLTKAKTTTKLSEKLKTKRRAFAERRKKKVLRTTVQGDENKITSGQEEATPHLHREGLSCALEVPSTRGSREGELLLLKKPP